MNDFKYHYLFTSFDLETFEMEDFRYNFVNITAFRLIDTNDVFVKETLKEMDHFSRLHHNVKFKKNLAVEVSGWLSCEIKIVGICWGNEMKSEIEKIKEEESRNVIQKFLHRDLLLKILENWK